jgi:hypothetical protein
MSDQYGAHRKAPDHDIERKFKELVWIFLYLALFLCALATYGTLLLHKFHVSHGAYGTPF